MQNALEEKRTELLRTETLLKELEEKYYSSSASVQSQVVEDLRVRGVTTACYPVVCLV